MLIFGKLQDVTSQVVEAQQRQEVAAEVVQQWRAGLLRAARDLGLGDITRGNYWHILNLKTHLRS